MKNLAIFYLICVVLLSAWPCSDELAAQEFTPQTIAKIDHDKTKDSTESCSPICLCACCGQSVVESQLVAFRLKALTFTVEHRMSISRFYLEHRVKNIWQPPKLV